MVYKPNGNGNIKSFQFGSAIMVYVMLTLFVSVLYVFARKDQCFGACRQVDCEMFILRSILVEKMISLIIFDTSFIQTIKCSLLEEKIIYSTA